MFSHTQEHGHVFQEELGLPALKGRQESTWFLCSQQLICNTAVLPQIAPFPPRI